MKQPPSKLLRTSCRPSALILSLLIASILFTGSYGQAQLRFARNEVAEETPSLRSFEPLANFDIRELSRPANTRTAYNLEQKRRRVESTGDGDRHLVLRWNETLDIPHSVFSTEGPLTSPSSDEPEAIARYFVLRNSEVFELSSTQLDHARVAARSRGNDGLTRIVLEQQVAGIRVFDSEMMFILDGKGSIVCESGAFIPEADLQAGRQPPSLDPGQALAKAAAFCGAEVSAPSKEEQSESADRSRIRFQAAGLDQRSEASLVYYPISRQEIRLAYQVLLYGVPTPLDAYLIILDANTSQALRRDALTYAFAPSGRVFTGENPVMSGGRQLVSFAGDATASPESWVSADVTSGNNAVVFFNPDLTGGSTVRANAQGNFDFPLDLAPGHSPLECASASAANLFYWVNYSHDRFYSLGFDERSRNFQANNFGRGGMAGDAVRADTLRGAAVNPADTSQPVRNNAYFQTSLDGSSPLLASLMWDGTGAELDSSYDASVIIHEYTHGVSTRLSGTDTSIGLRSMQGGGMGEGWSDFFAMSFLTNESPLETAVSTGGYVTQSNRGVRNYPYTTRFDLNPLTFGDIRATTEVHSVGTVWCSMLWDMRQAFIQRYGFESGRPAAEQLVINGLKATPLSPTFVDARDAILLADRTTNAGANQELIWRSFARRGLGFSASTAIAPPGVGFRTTAVEGFDIPPQFSSGEVLINDKPGTPAVLTETLPLIVVDRNATGSPSVNVNATNVRTGETTTLNLMATSAGRFAGTARFALPGLGGAGPAVNAITGDEVVFNYGDKSGARVTVGSRVVVYSQDFETDWAGWSWQSPWHLTVRRSSSGAQSLYFAKPKGENDKKSYTRAGSRGLAFSAPASVTGLLAPRLEFDSCFIGAGGGGLPNSASDLLSVVARNYPFSGVVPLSVEDPRLQATYDLRPQTDMTFRTMSIDLRSVGGRSVYFEFAFSASDAEVDRKKLEGFYLDNMRVTAVRMQ